MYQYYLFDLDGTLTDPGIGITNSVMYALKKYGIEVSDRRELYKFIGPTLLESFHRFYGFGEEQSREAVNYYREYFREKGMWENEVYPGILQVLRSLKEQGAVLGVATSKPEEFAIPILKHFDLYDYFDLAAGATMDSSRSKKTDVIAYAMEGLVISNRKKVLMVGDREQDIQGAKANGIASAGVLYGYGDLAELETAGAMHIVETPEGLLEL